MAQKAQTSKKNKNGSGKRSSNKNNAYESSGSNAAVLLIVMIVLAALIIYLGCFGGTSGFAGMVRGLNGDMSMTVGIAFAIFGIYQFIGRKYGHFSVLKCICGAVLLICVLTGAELLVCASIRDRMTIYSLSNFAYVAFKAQTGGGALGALAWVLKENLDIVGGMIALTGVSVAMLYVMLINVLRRLTGSAKEKITTIEEKRRTEHELDSMFPDDDEDTFEDDRANARSRKKPARRPAKRSLFDIADEQERSQETDEVPAQNSGNRGNDPYIIEYPDSVKPVNKPASKRRASRRATGSEEPIVPIEERKAPVAPVASPDTAGPAAKDMTGTAAKTQPDNERYFDDTDPYEDVPEYVPERRKGNAVRYPDITAVSRVRGTAPGQKANGDDFAGGHEHTVHTSSVLNGAGVSGTVDNRPRRATGMPPVDLPDDTPFVPDDTDNVPMDERDLTIEPDEYEVEDDEPAEQESHSKQLGTFHRHSAAPDDGAEPYNYPPIDLLEAGFNYGNDDTEDADLEKAQLLEDTLHSFGVDATMSGIAHCPAVTRFEFTLPRGVKVNRITGLADDIAYALAAESVRIEAPIPGKTAVGVEIPNDRIESVPLRDVLESDAARNHKSKIAACLGKDNAGRYIVADIDKLPHVLIAGQTGSGKSVCINSIIMSILYRSTPEEVKLILIDPKMVELSVYNDIPHLIAPVVTDPTKAAAALDWAVTEMTRRYKVFKDAGVRNIKGYNSHLQPGDKPMSRIIIIIDELADLMMASPGEVEDSICRLAQLARAAGMHLVIATQRPSVNVITGLIKANVPSRIAFKVASGTDSRTIYDRTGAEKLLGNGDMLYIPSGISKPLRVQGAWVSDEEVEAVVSYVKDHHHGAEYDEAMMDHINRKEKSDAERDDEMDSSTDDRLEEAIEIAIDAGQTSISMLQRKMRVGYARAGRLIDEMCRRGIVSEADGSKPRNVLITKEQFYSAFKDDEE